MQRIGSPSYDELRQPVSGRGFGRGCHAPSDGPRDGLYETAAHYVQRALSIWRDTVGTSHPDYAVGLSLQASLFGQTAQEIVAAHALRNPAHAVVDIRALSGR